MEVIVEVMSLWICYIQYMIESGLYARIWTYAYLIYILINIFVWGLMA